MNEEGDLRHRTGSISGLVIPTRTIPIHIKINRSIRILRCERPREEDYALDAGASTTEVRDSRS